MNGYKYRVKKKKAEQYQLENLVSQKATVVSEDELKGYAKKGLVTNAIVREGKLLQVKDALDTYVRLRDQIWEVASMKGLVCEKSVKNSFCYCIRLFDGYDEDVTLKVFDFIYSELGLKQDEKGNILFFTKGLDPLGDIKKAINIKSYRVQQELVPEDSKMVSVISEYRISKAMKEIIANWDC